MTDQQQFVKPQTEWTKEDKLVHLNIQKGVSGLGIFFSIVLCTNLFLINAWLSNHLTLGFGIVSLLLCLANISYLYWALNNYTKCQQCQDKYAEVTDNRFSRIVLFFSVIILVTFTIYYVIFSFANQDLINQFEANNQDKRIQEYKDYINGKIGWINFLSYANIVFLVYTIFCAYAMSGSHNTSRLMVYFIGIFMIFAVFYEFWAIQHLGFVFKKANFSFSSWAVTLLKALAISFMVIMFFTYIANAKKLRIAYLILGSFFLISCAIQIPATGQLFRDYQAVNEFYTNNCPKELGDLDVKYVEDLGCPNKYYYRTANKRMDCEAETSVPSQCFQSTDDCAKNFLYTAWEKALIKDPQVYSITACLNKSCCGISSNVYTRPLLTVASLAFVVTFLSFILACFCLNLSAKEKSTQTISQTLQMIPTVIFLIILIGGIFFVCLYDFKSLPKKDFIVPSLGVTANFKEINIERDGTLSHYPGFQDHCEQFSNIIQGRPFDRNGNSIVLEKIWNQGGRTGHKGLLIKQDNGGSGGAGLMAAGTNLGTNKIDLNNLYADGIYAEDNQIDANTKRPGVIVIVKTPDGGDNCKYNNGADVFVNGWFYFHNDEDIYGNEVKLISQETASILSQQKAASGVNSFAVNTDNIKKSKFIGFVGEQNTIETILTQKLHVCEWNVICNNVASGFDIKKAAFSVRVIKVDLTNYGFAAKAGQVHQKAEESSTLRKHNKKMLEKHYEEKLLKDIVYKKHAAPTAFYPKSTKQVEFKVKVHDFVNDKPIKNAKVTYYAYYGESDAAATAWGQAKDYNYKCDDHKYQDWSAWKQNYQSSFTQTNRYGESTIEFLFFEDFSATPTPTSQAYTYIIFAEADGYAKNCRAIQMTSAQMEKYQFLDIGLSSFMKKGQARVVLEWDRFAEVAASAPEIDLDLHGSFGNTIGNDKFSCNVGPQSNNCGGVEYHGDNTAKKIGRSSEAITLDLIGNYDYLFFFRRYVENFQKKIFPQPNSPDLATKFNQQIFSVYPVLKYFTEGQKKHNAVIKLSELIPETINWQQSFGTPAAPKFWYDGTQKFYILSMCLRAGKTNRINPYKFKNGNYDITQFYTADKKCGPATTPACTAATAWAPKTLTPIWSDLFTASADMKVDVPFPYVPLKPENINLYADVEKNSLPNVNTPLFRPSDFTDPTVFRVCDVTDIMEDWAYDTKAVNKPNWPA